LVSVNEDAEIEKPASMDNSTLIITASDQHYFELVQSCLSSIRDKPLGKSLKIAFLDLGCTQEQLAWLAEHVDFIRIPDWEFDVPNRETKPLYLRGLLARPFLRRYFPGFEIYIWVDADAWLQRWDTVVLLQQAALARKGLAIVPEVDRCSVRQFGGLPAYWSQSMAWYTNAFGEPVAQKLFSYPMLNAGVFAMHQEAPHWDIWRDCLASALQNTCTSMTDQLSLNVAVYLQGLMPRTELLPYWCNWTCHNGFPKWDDSSMQFVETWMPRTPIGILHITTRDKSTIRRIDAISGTSREMKVIYPVVLEYREA
jgi:hypothetical protein